jgi:hypothetical protein
VTFSRMLLMATASPTRTAAAAADGCAANTLMRERRVAVEGLQRTTWDTSYFRATVVRSKHTRHATPWRAHALRANLVANCRSCGQPHGQT